MSQSVRVATIGAGYFSAFHRDAWTRIDGAELIACCDSNAEALAPLSIPTFTDVDAMLAQMRPDLVDIITPPPTHLPLIEHLINAGVKTLICQKPFCTSLGQARQAAQTAQREGVHLVVHENFRFQPWFRAMKTLIASGRLGQITNFTFRLRTGDGQGPNAYLDRQPYFQKMSRFLVHETAIHYVDVFRYLFGDPAHVYADLRRLNPAIAGEDAGHFIFGFRDGLRVVFDGNRLVDHASDNPRRTFGEALLEGTGGTAHLTGDGRLTFRPYGRTTSETVLEPQDWRGFAGDSVHAFQSHVIAALGGQAEWENRAGDYLANLALEEVIYESASTGIRLDV